MSPPKGPGRPRRTSPPPERIGLTIRLTREEMTVAQRAAGRRQAETGKRMSVSALIREALERIVKEG